MIYRMYHTPLCNVVMCARKF